MIETVEPKIAVSNVSAKRGQFSQQIEYTNRLGYPIAVITKNGINAVIHPAMNITTDGTFTIAVTYSANHHCTLNQLPHFYKESPDLAKKIPEPTPKNPRNDLITLEYNFTDSQLGFDDVYYVDDLDIIVCTAVSARHYHPRSAHYVTPEVTELSSTALTLAGCAEVGRAYYVLFADTIVRIVNTTFGLDDASITFASTDQSNIINSYTLRHGDVFINEEDAVSERSRRISSYNEASGDLIKGAKVAAESHYKLVSGASKDYLSENNGLIGTVQDMSSAVGKLENDITDAKIHQRKVAAESMKLVHPLVTTIGKVANL